MSPEVQKDKDTNNPSGETPVNRLQAAPFSHISSEEFCAVKDMTIFHYVIRLIIE